MVLDLRTDSEVALEGPGPMTAERTVRIEHRSLYPDAAEHADRDVRPVSPWALADDGESPDESPFVRAYLSYVRRRPDSVAESVRTIARAERAVLVHCAAGKDRTGVVVAVALDAAGVDRETIVEDYLASAHRIDAIVARLVSSTTYRPGLEGRDPQELAPLLGTMERFLELIDERLGGSVSWLRDAGAERRRSRAPAAASCARRGLRRAESRPACELIGRTGADQPRDCGLRAAAAPSDPSARPATPSSPPKPVDPARRLLPRPYEEAENEHRAADVMNAAAMLGRGDRLPGKRHQQRRVRGLRDGERGRPPGLPASPALNETHIADVRRRGAAARSRRGAAAPLTTKPSVKIP